MRAPGSIGGWRPASSRRRRDGVRGVAKRATTGSCRVTRTPLGCGPAAMTRPDTATGPRRSAKVGAATAMVRHWAMAMPAATQAEAKTMANHAGCRRATTPMAPTPASPAPAAQAGGSVGREK